MLGTTALIKSQPPSYEFEFDTAHAMPALELLRLSQHARLARNDVATTSIGTWHAARTRPSQAAYARCRRGEEA